jgi:hypothetical protein
MLKNTLLIVLLIIGVIECFIPCEDPSAYVGSWVSSKYARELYSVIFCIWILGEKIFLNENKA